MSLNRTARRGATVIETAIVLPVFVLLLFGVFEFGRYLMALHVVENAAREGSRLAVVNTEKLSTTEIQDAVRKKLLSQVSSPNIQVYRADPTTGANIGPWNEAGLAECIAVEVTATYTPLMASLGIVPSSVRMSTKSIMRSESN